MDYRFEIGSNVFIRNDIKNGVHEIVNHTVTIVNLWRKKVEVPSYTLDTKARLLNNIKETMLSSVEGYDSLYPYVVLSNIYDILKNDKGETVVEFDVGSSAWYEVIPEHFLSNDICQNLKNKIILAEILGPEVARIISIDGVLIPAVTSLGLSPKLEKGDRVTWNVYGSAYLERSTEYPLPIGGILKASSLDRDLYVVTNETGKQSEGCYVHRFSPYAGDTPISGFPKQEMVEETLPLIDMQEKNPDKVELLAWIKKA